MPEGTLSAAIALSVLGGMLTIILGCLYLAEILLPGAGGVQYSDFEIVGGLTLLAGILLVVLGVGLALERESRAGIGVGIVVISAVTFWGGLLFVPGIILCVAGGLLAILHEDTDEELPNPWNRPAATGRPGPLQECPSCHQPVGLATRFCPECGAGLRR